MYAIISWLSPYSDVDLFCCPFDILEQKEQFVEWKSLPYRVSFNISGNQKFRIWKNVYIIEGCESSIELKFFRNFYDSENQ